MDNFQVLYKWNRWGDWEPDFGYRRQVLNDIISCLDEPEVITIIGPRRAGKSTVLYQIIEHLEQIGVDKKACLHINFEEPALSLALSLEMLDNLYDTYRGNVFPEGKAYIFFDEI